MSILGLFDDQRSDQLHDGSVIGEHADDVCLPLDFLVYALQRIGARRLSADGRPTGVGPGNLMKASASSSAESMSPIEDRKSIEVAA
jgi:hypothetical protein